MTQQYQGSKMYTFRFLLLIATVALATTACYRMPAEDEYSLVPFTNNPDVTRNKSSGSMMPGASI
jgi:hypothetical protein